jgi:hypothetical protein
MVMSERWALVMATVAALSAPAALGQSRPTSTHAVGPDGSVYYTVRTEGSVIRVAPDGSSEVVANALDAPTGLAFEDDGHLLVADEVGTHRIYLAEGTIGVLQAEPTAYEPYVRFDQTAWTYRKNRIKVRFTHNLEGQSPLFDIEVSRNGGRTWRRAASGLREPIFSLQGDDSWPIHRTRFRVTAYVDGQRICSDVSDQYEDPATAGRRLPGGE